jgi:DNA-binding Xre family transcriptional regulator
MMPTVSEQLREAIRTCGKTRADIARECGVAESVLSRFVAGGEGLRSQNLDTLCRFLGLKLTAARGTRSTGRKGKG